MDHQIEAGFDRPLNPRSCKCIVADRDNLVFAGDLRDRLKIDQLEQWIARSLDPNHACVWFDRAFEVFYIREIDVREIKIGGTAPDLIEQPKRAAVEIVACDDV